MMGADLTDREHTWWSDPEHHAPRLSELPQAPAAIADALEEFVIPAVVARLLGFDVPSAAQRDRGARRVALLLGEAVNETRAR